jgi:hypothetical protein
MATQRVITPAAQPVNINPQGQANPAGCQIEDGQTVTFNNNSGSTISIVFARTAITDHKVFDDIVNLANNASDSQIPQVASITVNYTVTMGGPPSEPFAIEVGTGPLEISVTGTNPTPVIAAIPPNGEVQFTATDYQCDIHWQDRDPFTPPLNNVYVGQSNNQVGEEHGNSGKSFNYTLTESSAAHPVDGGGTIKVT